ncbi:MAG: hypothetical protein K2W81_11575 [Sphingomonas sp.]|uniref:oxidoreductase n=1 Tax=Sphingomonas sp. TaxID=28214 RepID=UPI0025E53858|nr:hypothetical protein [Sphingomonas sp.]MBY0284589.1 hypothetical protein [Sphingomonas sp.]
MKSPERHERTCRSQHLYRAGSTLEVTDAVTSVWGAERVGIRLSPSLTINGMSDSNPAPVFGYLAEQLGKRGLAYLHCVEPSSPRGDPFDRIVDPRIVRKAFGGNYIANGSYTGERARAALASGEIDAASFGRLFIANADLPRRLTEDLPMNPLNADRIYCGGADDYTDHPFAD